MAAICIRFHGRSTFSPIREAVAWKIRPRSHRKTEATHIARVVEDKMKKKKVLKAAPPSENSSTSGATLMKVQKKPHGAKVKQQMMNVPEKKWNELTKLIDGQKDWDVVEVVSVKHLRSRARVNGTSPAQNADDTTRDEKMPSTPKQQRINTSGQSERFHDVSVSLKSVSISSRKQHKPTASSHGHSSTFHTGQSPNLSLSPIPKSSPVGSAFSSLLDQTDARSKSANSSINDNISDFERSFRSFVNTSKNGDDDDYVDCSDDEEFNEALVGTNCLLNDSTRKSPQKGEQVAKPAAKKIKGPLGNRQIAQKKVLMKGLGGARAVVKKGPKKRNVYENVSNRKAKKNLKGKNTPLVKKNLGGAEKRKGSGTGQRKKTLRSAKDVAGPTTVHGEKASKDKDSVHSRFVPGKTVLKDIDHDASGSVHGKKASKHVKGVVGGRVPGKNILRSAQGSARTRFVPGKKILKSDLVGTSSVQLKKAMSQVEAGSVATIPGKKVSSAQDSIGTQCVTSKNVLKSSGIVKTVTVPGKKALKGHCVGTGTVHGKKVLKTTDASSALTSHGNKVLNIAKNSTETCSSGAAYVPVALRTDGSVGTGTIKGALGSVAGFVGEHKELLGGGYKAGDESLNQVAKRLQNLKKPDGIASKQKGIKKGKKKSPVGLVSGDGMLQAQESESEDQDDGMAVVQDRFGGGDQSLHQAAKRFQKVKKLDSVASRKQKGIKKGKKKYAVDQISRDGMLQAQVSEDQDEDMAVVQDRFEAGDQSLNQAAKGWQKVNNPDSVALRKQEGVKKGKKKSAVGLVSGDGMLQAQESESEDQDDGMAVVQDRFGGGDQSLHQAAKRFQKVKKLDSVASRKQKGIKKGKKKYAVDQVSGDGMLQAQVSEDQDEDMAVVQDRFEAGDQSLNQAAKGWQKVNNPDSVALRKQEGVKKGKKKSAVGLVVGGGMLQAQDSEDHGDDVAVVQDRFEAGDQSLNQAAKGLQKLAKPDSVASRKQKEIKKGKKKSAIGPGSGGGMLQAQNSEDQDDNKAVVQDRFEAVVQDMFEDHHSESKEEGGRVKVGNLKKTKRKNRVKGKDKGLKEAQSELGVSSPLKRKWRRDQGEDREAENLAVEGDGDQDGKGYLLNGKTKDGKKPKKKTLRNMSKDGGCAGDEEESGRGMMIDQETTKEQKRGKGEDKDKKKAQSRLPQKIKQSSGQSEEMETGSSEARGEGDLKDSSVNKGKKKRKRRNKRKLRSISEGNLVDPGQTKGKNLVEGQDKNLQKARPEIGLGSPLKRKHGESEEETTESLERKRDKEDDGKDLLVHDETKGKRGQKKRKLKSRRVRGVSRDEAFDVESCTQEEQENGKGRLVDLERTAGKNSVVWQDKMKKAQPKVGEDSPLRRLQRERSEEGMTESLEAKGGGGQNGKDSLVYDKTKGRSRTGRTKKLLSNKQMVRSVSRDEALKVEGCGQDEQETGKGRLLEIEKTQKKKSMVGENKMKKAQWKIVECSPWRRQESRESEERMTESLEAEGGQEFFMNDRTKGRKGKKKKLGYTSIEKSVDGESRVLDVEQRRKGQKKKNLRNAPEGETIDGEACAQSEEETENSADSEMTKGKGNSRVERQDKDQKQAKAKLGEVSQKRKQEKGQIEERETERLEAKGGIEQDSKGSAVNDKKKRKKGTKKRKLINRATVETANAEQGHLGERVAKEQAVGKIGSKGGLGNLQGAEVNLVRRKRLSTEEMAQILTNSTKKKRRRLSAEVEQRHTRVQVKLKFPDSESRFVSPSAVTSPSQILNVGVNKEKYVKKRRQCHAAADEIGVLPRTVRSDKRRSPRMHDLTRLPGVQANRHAVTVVAQVHPQSSSCLTAASPNVRPTDCHFSSDGKVRSDSVKEGDSKKQKNKRKGMSSRGDIRDGTGKATLGRPWGVDKGSQKTRRKKVSFGPQIDADNNSLPVSAARQNVLIDQEASIGQELDKSLRDKPVEPSRLAEAKRDMKGSDHSGKKVSFSNASVLFDDQIELEMEVKSMETSVCSGHGNEELDLGEIERDHDETDTEGDLVNDSLYLQNAGTDSQNNQDDLNDDAYDLESGAPEFQHNIRCEADGQPDDTLILEDIDGQELFGKEETGGRMKNTDDVGPGMGLCETADGEFNEEGRPTEDAEDECLYHIRGNQQSLESLVLDNETFGSLNGDGVTVRKRLFGSTIQESCGDSFWENDVIQIQQTDKEVGSNHTHDDDGAADGSRCESDEKLKEVHQDQDSAGRCSGCDDEENDEITSRETESALLKDVRENDKGIVNRENVELPSVDTHNSVGIIRDFVEEVLNEIDMLPPSNVDGSESDEEEQQNLQEDAQSEEEGSELCGNDSDGNEEEERDSLEKLDQVKTDATMDNLSEPTVCKFKRNPVNAYSSSADETIRNVLELSTLYELDEEGTSGHVAVPRKWNIDEFGFDLENDEGTRPVEENVGVSASDNSGPQGASEINLQRDEPHCQQCIDSSTNGSEKTTGSHLCNSTEFIEETESMVNDIQQSEVIGKEEDGNVAPPEMSSTHGPLSFVKEYSQMTEEREDSTNDVLQVMEELGDSVNCNEDKEPEESRDIVAKRGFVKNLGSKRKLPKVIGEGEDSANDLPQVMEKVEASGIEQHEESGDIEGNQESSAQSFPHDVKNTAIEGSCNLVQFIDESGNVAGGDSQVLEDIGCSASGNENEGDRDVAMNKKSSAQSFHRDLQKTASEDPCNSAQPLGESDNPESHVHEVIEESGSVSENDKNRDDVVNKKLPAESLHLDLQKMVSEEPCNSAQSMGESDITATCVPEIIEESGSLNENDKNRDGVVNKKSSAQSLHHDLQKVVSEEPCNSTQSMGESDNPESHVPEITEESGSIGNDKNRDDVAKEKLSSAQSLHCNMQKVVSEEPCNSAQTHGESDSTAAHAPGIFEEFGSDNENDKNRGGVVNKKSSAQSLHHDLQKVVSEEPCNSTQSMGESDNPESHVPEVIEEVGSLNENDKNRVNKKSSAESLRHDLQKVVREEPCNSAQSMGESDNPECHIPEIIKDSGNITEYDKNRDDVAKDKLSPAQKTVSEGSCNAAQSLGESDNIATHVPEVIEESASVKENGKSTDVVKEKLFSQESTQERRRSSSKLVAEWEVSTNNDDMESEKGGAVTEKTSARGMSGIPVKNNGRLQKSVETMKDSVSSVENTNDALEKSSAQGFSDVPKTSDCKRLSSTAQFELSGDAVNRPHAEIQESVSAPEMTSTESQTVVPNKAGQKRSQNSIQDFEVSENLQSNDKVVLQENQGGGDVVGPKMPSAQSHFGSSKKTPGDRSQSSPQDFEESENLASHDEVIVVDLQDSANGNENQESRDVVVPKMSSLHGHLGVSSKTARKRYQNSPREESENVVEDLGDLASEDEYQESDDDIFVEDSEDLASDDENQESGDLVVPKKSSFQTLARSLVLKERAERRSQNSSLEFEKSENSASDDEMYVEESEHSASDGENQESGDIVAPVSKESAERSRNSPREFEESENSASDDEMYVEESENSASDGENQESGDIVSPVLKERAERRSQNSPREFEESENSASDDEMYVEESENLESDDEVYVDESENLASDDDMFDEESQVSASDDENQENGDFVVPKKSSVRTPTPVPKKSARKWPQISPQEFEESENSASDDEIGIEESGDSLLCREELEYSASDDEIFIEGPEDLPSDGDFAIPQRSSTPEPSDRPKKLTQGGAKKIGKRELEGLKKWTLLTSHLSERPGRPNKLRGTKSPRTQRQEPAADATANKTDSRAQTTVGKRASIYGLRENAAKFKPFQMPQEKGRNSCDGAVESEAGDKDMPGAVDKVTPSPSPAKVARTSSTLMDPKPDEKEALLGQVVWAKFGGPKPRWWPGIVVQGNLCFLREAKIGHSWIFWFGDHKVSEISHEKMVPFTLDFLVNMKKSSAMGKMYHRAVIEGIEICLERAGLHEKQSDEDLLLWAQNGFMKNGKSLCGVLDRPSGRHTLPELVVVGLQKLNERFKKAKEEEDAEEKLTRLEELQQRKATSGEDALADVRTGKRNIRDMCIACSSLQEEVVTQHPFFDGGLCMTCKEELMDTMFAFGSDGTGVYCIICGNGGDLFVCDKKACNRVYCTGCIVALVGSNAIDTIHETNPWLCFMCSDYQEETHGLLVKKDNWKQNVLGLFQHFTTEPAIPDDMESHPLRVLSLFDGIGTGKYVLDQLGFEVEVYYASEIDQDAINVTKMQHGESITHIGDVRNISSQKLMEIGPIDLLIGGSPCNELSLCNPARKGLGEGTGVLFFEFYRIWTCLQALNKDRPLFWLFENVVSMPKEVKSAISRFLKCEPAKLDAKYFSPHQRARYFWGNLPGIYCPPQLDHFTEQGVSLNNVLTPFCNRVAKFQRLRTVTTKSNSLHLSKDSNSPLPVVMDGKSDTLWIPEMERLFGFPSHYTDVGNLAPGRRHRLLGKSWSVPVIKHLLMPLKQFFTLKEDGEPQGTSSSPL